MIVTLTINLDNEQTAAVTGVVDLRNETNGTEVSVEQHLTEIVDSEVLRYVADAYRASVEYLGQAASALPYDERQALIEQIKNQINNPA